MRALIARPDRPVSPAIGQIRGIVRAIRRSRHKLLLGSRVRFGRNVIVGAEAVLLPPTLAVFGDNVAIGRGFHLETNVEVGSNVLISSHVALVGNDHRFDDPTRTVFEAERLPSATVRIEGDNLIGYGTTIIGDVTIGRGCIVGARSIVTSDLPANWICYGAPARPRRPRHPSPEDV